MTDQEFIYELTKPVSININLSKYSLHGSRAITEAIYKKSFRFYSAAKISGRNIIAQYSPTAALVYTLSNL